MDDVGLTRANVQQYSPGVLVGNWYEDMTLREDQLKIYKSQKLAATASAAKSAANPLAHAAQAERLQEPTEITASPGDEVRIGQPYLILNESMHATLAVDVPPTIGSAALTASTVATPQVRTTWTLQRCKDEHNLSYNRNKPDVLHYGQRVRLANENASGKGFLYVQTALQSGLRSSETQQAVAAYHPCADNVFVVGRPGAVREDVHYGTPVKVGEGVTLLHSITNLPLACNGTRVGTSFGMEYAVTCGYTTDYASRSRGAVVVRPENVFCFSAGAGGDGPPPMAKSKSGTASMSSTLFMTTGSGVAELLERIRAGALEIGGRIGFRSLSIALGVACEEQRRRLFLNSNALRSAIARLGVRLTPVELDVLMKRFDTTGDNLVCAQELLAELRGVMPQDRLQAVIYAYQQLTIEGKGAVVFKEMHRLFCANAGALPAVVDGLLQPEEAVLDFESCWPGRVGCKIGTVTLDEFVEYNADISPAEASDERFCETVQKAWAVPATDAYMSAGPRRVINVIYGDDSSVAVPIPDSLVLNTHDPDSVKRLLIQRGFRNVKSFTVSNRGAS